MYSVIFKLFILLLFSVTVGLVAGVAYIYRILTNIRLFLIFSFYLFGWGAIMNFGGEKKKEKS